MHAFTEHPHRVPFEGGFRLHDVPTASPPTGRRRAFKERLAEHACRIGELAQVLQAHDSHAVLVVLQGMDGAGKGGTIRKVFAEVEPAVTRVYAFKPPSAEEIDHDFLWRAQRRAPERGMIHVFDRSHYEEVLVPRVHPEVLERQKLRSRSMRERIWEKRFRAIRDWERHLADSGTVVLKFFLHLSWAEQRERFLARIDTPEKHWKFEPADVDERQHWRAYQQAYEEALAETSRAWAPWYAVPADDKHYARAVVAEVVAATLERLDLAWPEPDAARRRALDRMRAALLAEDGPR